MDEIWHKQWLVNTAESIYWKECFEGYMERALKSSIRFLWKAYIHSLSTEQSNQIDRMKGNICLNLNNKKEIKMVESTNM